MLTLTIVFYLFLSVTGQSANSCFSRYIGHCKAILFEYIYNRRQQMTRDGQACTRVYRNSAKLNASTYSIEHLADLNSELQRNVDGPGADRLIQLTRPFRRHVIEERKVAGAFDTVRQLHDPTVILDDFQDMESVDVDAFFAKWPAVVSVVAGLVEVYIDSARRTAWESTSTLTGEDRNMHLTLVRIMLLLQKEDIRKKLFRLDHIFRELPMNRYIEEQCDRTTATFKEDEESTCFVHSYLQRMPSNDMLTHEQLRATRSDFFVAGQETTTTTLRWAMLFLADNQEAQSKVREEILAVVGRSRLPSMADNPKMPYTSATVLEVQRRANILASNVTRQSTADCTIKGVKIPAGSYINGDIHYILANDPIFKNPKEFRPERYLMDDGKTLNKEAVEHTIPFPLGKRQCAGEGLARVELFLGLAATFQHYRILPPIDRTPINLEPEFFQFHFPKPQKLQLVPL